MGSAWQKQHGCCSGGCGKGLTTYELAARRRRREFPGILAAKAKFL